MKNSSASDVTLNAQAILRFGTLTDVDVKELLLPFYVNLGFDDRRARFGGAMSDDAVTKHCERLDRHDAIILGCWAPSRLLAAVELHPVTEDWEFTELGIADCAERDRTTIIAHLLQLAAFAAGKRGCTTLLIPSCRGDLVNILRGMGKVRAGEDEVFVDIADYARIFCRAGRTAEHQLTIPVR